MCHAVRVKLTAEERSAARRFTGYLVPVYAVIALAVMALATLSQGPREGTMVASTPAAAGAPAQAGR